MIFETERMRLKHKAHIETSIERANRLGPANSKGLEYHRGFRVPRQKQIVDAVVADVELTRRTNRNVNRGDNK